MKALSSLEKHLLAAMVRHHGHALIKREIDIISQVPRKLGRRPRQLGSTQYETLAHNILWLADAHRKQGSKTPVGAAIKEAAELEGKDADTIKRYYTEGRRRLGRSALRELAMLIKKGK